MITPHTGICYIKDNKEWSLLIVDFNTIFRSDAVDYSIQESSNIDEDSSSVDEDYDPREELFDDGASLADGRI